MRERVGSPFAFAILGDVYGQSITGFPSLVRIPLSSLVVPGPVLALRRAEWEMGLAV